MNTLLGVILIFSLFILLLFLSIYIKTQRQGNRLIRHAKDLLDSRMDQFIMGLQNNYILAADAERKIYVYADPQKDFVFHYDSVLGVSLVKHNEIVSECLSPKISEDSNYAKFYEQSKSKLMLRSSDGISTTDPSSIRVYIFLADEHTPLLEIDCFSSKKYLFLRDRSANLTVEESQLYRRGLQIGHHIVMLINKSLNVETVFPKE